MYELLGSPDVGFQQCFDGGDDRRWYKISHGKTAVGKILNLRHPEVVSFFKHIPEKCVFL